MYLQTDPVRIQDISKTFKGKKGRIVTAVNHLSLTVGQGEILGVLGPNGAGKSTTIKMLTGQILPDSGEISLFGQKASQSAARRFIGYLPENPAFFNFLSAREYLGLVGKIYGLSGKVLVLQSERVLDLLDLTAAADRPISGFSKGMVQRLGLAQTLLHDPELYILDEPMSGLDPMGRALVKEVMMQLRDQGKSVFFSTHVIADVEAVCDRVAIIVDGRLLSINVVKDLLGKGIEGYSIQVADCPDGLFEGFKVNLQPDGIHEVFVPRAELNHFLSKATGAQADILLMEPQRRTLEEFFLKIVECEGE